MRQSRSVAVGTAPAEKLGGKKSSVLRLVGFKKDSRLWRRLAKINYFTTIMMNLFAESQNFRGWASENQIQVNLLHW